MIRVNGKEHRWRREMTVSDLIGELDDGFFYAVVRVNGKYISKPDFEKSVVPDDSEVFFIPMIAGG
jgi:thiamine biosynthesis protein ThiS